MIKFSIFSYKIKSIQNKKGKNYRNHIYSYELDALGMAFPEQPKTKVVAEEQRL